MDKETWKLSIDLLRYIDERNFYIKYIKNKNIKNI